MEQITEEGGVKDTNHQEDIISLDDELDVKKDHDVIKADDIVDLNFDSLGEF